MSIFDFQFIIRSSLVFGLAITTNNVKCLALSESTCNLASNQEQEVIWVMPAQLATDEEVESISQAHGTVIELIGQGPEAMVRVKKDQTDFVVSQKDFINDKRFSQTERTCIFMIEESQSFKAKLAKLAPL